MSTQNIGLAKDMDSTALSIYLDLLAAIEKKSKTLIKVRTFTQRGFSKNANLRQQAKIEQS